LRSGTQCLRSVLFYLAFVVAIILYRFEKRWFQLTSLCRYLQRVVASECHIVIAYQMGTAKLFKGDPTNTRTWKREAVLFSLFLAYCAGIMVFVVCYGWAF
jgi:hypothetical protein